MNWITELGWGIELIVMYARWCDIRDYHPEPKDDEYFKRLFVTMCMRMGFDRAQRVVAAQQMGRLARIIDGDPWLTKV